MNVMLVDDEYISNFINKKLIQTIDATIELVEFNDPCEAFSKLNCIKPDLIFLDINMPLMNGWDFLDKMLAESLHFKVVILTSSVNMIDRRMAGKYINVIGYLEKPATLASIAPYIVNVAVAVA